MRDGGEALQERAARKGALQSVQGDENSGQTSWKGREEKPVTSPGAAQV